MYNMSTNAQVAKVVQELGLPPISTDWKGLDTVWNVFEKMGNEGAVIVFKIDGQRTTEDDNGRYTVVISDGPLGEDFFRVDVPVLEEGLAKAILYYAEKCWKKK